jgi:long-subunit acyl-CoA synthetase (AMP-forming)
MMFLCTSAFAGAADAAAAGNPKGVMHSHGSVMSEVECMREFLDSQNMKVQPRDVYFSFLTLAHIFDRCAALPAQLCKHWACQHVRAVRVADWSGVTVLLQGCSEYCRQLVMLPCTTGHVIHRALHCL